MCRDAPQSHPRGLTRKRCPLYSARFAAPGICPATEGPCGGTGRRARLKIEFRKECWFDSGQGHQLGCSPLSADVRSCPRSVQKPLKNRHFRLHRCSSPFVLIRSQPCDLLVFLLVCVGIGRTNVHGDFCFSERGIEPMVRKNDGPHVNPKQIRTDVDCRAARPKFGGGTWSPAKISDVTGGGLYLFITPDVSRPGNAASKLWRIG